MKILRLDLSAYGCFTDTTLDFSVGSPGVHVIFGENEAGKSTTLRALEGLLYGIEVRTADGFLHPNQKLRIGGLLEHADGRQLEIVRRKGSKGTLFDEAGEPLSDDVLLEFLPAADREVFTSLYGINHEALVRGGREILDAEGDVGKVLFSAASGITRLTQVLAELEASAKDLFKRGGSKAEVNRALGRFKTARKAAKAATLKITDWTQLQSDHGKLEEELALVETRLSDAQRNHSRLERLSRVLTPLGERRAVVEALEALHEVIRLPAEARAERKDAQGRLAAARRRLAGSEDKQKRHLDALAALGEPSALRGSEKKIKALTKELAVVEKARKDRVSQKGQQQLAKNSAREALSAVRPDLSLEDLDPLRPLMLRRKTISSLAEQSRSNAKGRSEVTRRIRKLEADLEEHQEALGKLGEAPETTHLKAAVAEARAKGDLDDRVKEARREEAKAVKKVTVELARLAPFTGSLPELMERSWLAEEAIDSFKERLARIEETERDHTRLRGEQELERIEVESQLQKLMKGEALTSDDDLRDARECRAQAWQLVRRVWLDGEDVAAETADLLGERALPEGYEGLVIEADQVADTLRHDARWVHERSSLDEQLAKNAKRQAVLAVAQSKVESQRVAWSGEWKSTWAPWGFEPARPEQMKAWITRAAGLREMAERVEELGEETSNLVEAREHHRETLLSLVGEPKEAGDEPFSSLLARCDQRVNEGDQLEKARQQASTAIDHFTRDLNEAREQLADIEAADSTWKASWIGMVEGLQVDPDAAPSLAEAVMEQLAEVFEAMDTAAQHGRRIYGITKDIEEFEAEVQAFVERTGYAKGDLDWFELAARLGDELEEATKVETRRAGILKELAELEEEIASARIEVDAAEDRLVVLRVRAGVETDAALEQAEARSVEVAELEARRAELEKVLGMGSDGLSLEALEADADGVDPDALPGQLEQVKVGIQELSAERDTLRDRRTALVEDMKRHDGQATASIHEEEAQSALSEIRDGATRYLRLSIASLVLKQEIERYRAANQAPLLKRASELFARLTLGSFAGLRDELGDDGKPVLLGIRADDDAVGVEGMSEGARDQLFLALRLAILEQTVEKGHPVPFVVDDILVGFDDARTEACLEVLAELGAKMQILLFTHHKSVSDAAIKLGVERDVHIHSLETRKPNGSRPDHAVISHLGASTSL